MAEDTCLICGNTLAKHNMGAGVPTCPTVAVPTFRSSKAALTPVREDEVERRTNLIDAIISAYHTTRLLGVPAAQHILTKSRVQRAFAALSRPNVDEMREALEKCKAALLSNPPYGPQKTVVGDDTVYHLDGAAVGNALEAVRAALRSAS